MFRRSRSRASPYDHLGTVITYFVTTKAKAAVCIVLVRRPEHLSAITWLNEYDFAGFYRLNLEAIKIGSSDPAPLLTLIVVPTEATKAKQESEERLRATDVKLSTSARPTHSERPLMTEADVLTLQPN